MINEGLAQISILMSQSRYDEAEKILKNLLADQPENADYLGTLAEVYFFKDMPQKANEIVDLAISNDPDNSVHFFNKSRIALDLKDIVSAERYIKEAIQLDAYDADYFAYYGGIRIDQKRFEEALAFTEQALEIDSENIIALNFRSKALLKLNRADDSFETIESALKEDPNNSFTHANFGWGLLEKGDHKKAMEHFKEALKLDPSSEFAKSGMLEAIKAKNFIYRMFLKYAFWMENKTSGQQWGLIIGVVILMRFLRTMVKSEEALIPFLVPLMIILMLFIFSSWYIPPLSEAILRFHKYGKHLLDKYEMRSSLLVVICIGLLVVGGLLALVTGDQRFFSLVAFGAVMIPIAGRIYYPSKYKVMFIYPIVMAIIGITATILIFSMPDNAGKFWAAFALGAIAYTWIVNLFMLEDEY